MTIEAIPDDLTSEQYEKVQDERRKQLEVFKKNNLPFLIQQREATIAAGEVIMRVLREREGKEEI
jgi:hypothetical protein